eukprot:Gb_31831 [translate_table: standard]
MPNNSPFQAILEQSQLSNFPEQKSEAIGPCLYMQLKPSQGWKDFLRKSDIYLNHSLPVFHGAIKKPVSAYCTLGSPMRHMYNTSLVSHVQL